MASPNSSWTEIITSTIQSRTKKLADNISNNNAILMRMKERKRMKTVSGGNVIAQELEYSTNSAVMYYAGWETLSLAPSDIMTAAEFNYKQLAGAVMISGLEQLQNSGDQKMIDLISARVRNAEKSLANTIATGMYSDGTGTNNKQIGGLQLLVADTNTNTVGGISGNTDPWWKNVVYDVSSAQSSAASSTTIQTCMNNIYMQLVRGTDAPDLILTDNVYYGKYLGSLQTIQRITTDKMAQAGFTSLQYMGSDVVLDGGVGANCPASHMYFLNSDYIYWRPHADRNLVPLDPDRYSTNQDGVIKLIGWAGNMTVANRSLQGVMKA